MPAIRLKELRTARVFLLMLSRVIILKEPFARPVSEGLLKGAASTPASGSGAAPVARSDKWFARVDVRFGDDVCLISTETRSGDPDHEAIETLMALSVSDKRREFLSGTLMSGGKFVLRNGSAVADQIRRIGLGIDPPRD